MREIKYQKIDFLIVGASYQGRKNFYYNLAQEFHKKGYQSCVLTGCYEEYRQLKNQQIYCLYLNNLIRILNKIKNIEEKASQIEKKYNIPSLNNFIFTEKCYCGEKDNYLIKKAIICFEVLEKLLMNLQPKCVIQNQGGEIHRRVLHMIARKRGIPVIYFGESFFPDKMLLHSDEMNTLTEYKNIPWDEVTDNQKREIEKHIEDFVSQKSIFRYFFFKKRTLIEFFRIFLGYVKNREFRNLRIALRTKFKWYIIDNFNKLFSVFLYQDYLKDEKFIYFPLHVPDDSQITIRNPQFYDQASLALYIAKMIPFGYKLYVKEHPGSLISVRDKRRLNKENSIVLLNPRINSHLVIEKSKAIVIINSTVGFEALHYSKPVIVLGNWNLKGKGITIDVDNIFNLDKAIKFALETRVNPEKIKAFLFSLKESMYEGSILKKNIDYPLVVQSLIKKFNKSKNKYFEE
ncbi:hypothetical protein KJA13_00695 [Patescibacteria group bacterium]|nr:hypothetical protein [Patescibacteria group bacterium]